MLGKGLEAHGAPRWADGVAAVGVEAAPYVLEERLGADVAAEGRPSEAGRGAEGGPDGAGMVGEDVDVVKELIVHHDLGMGMQRAAEEVRPRAPPREDYEASRRRRRASDEESASSAEELAEVRPRLLRVRAADAERQLRDPCHCEASKDDSHSSTM